MPAFPKAISKYIFHVGLLITMVFGLSGAFGSFSTAHAQNSEEPDSLNPLYPKNSNQSEMVYQTDQIIIKYADSLQKGTQFNPASLQRMQQLSGTAGVTLSYVREMSGNAHVLRLPKRISATALAVITHKLEMRSDVVSAEPDLIMRHTLTPNDALYGSQWHYFPPATGNFGINAPGAWDITTGSSTIIVSVVDTGITAHAEFTGRTVPGYDFISDIPTANDGDGRDNDPSDPGDWVIDDECYGGSEGSDSTWHGTHTAGTIGAASNNGSGVAGINWHSMILPVRVIGKCGGYSSDVIDAMLWSAGLPVTGVPINPNIARVINLSLGGEGSCSTSFQDAIDAITTAGTTIVVSAGNSNIDAVNFAPANCDGVITVAATNRSGNRSWYSNYGSLVEISAPGGDSSGGILSTFNTGAQGPDTDGYAYYQGTSMAAPHVSGVVSLLLSLNPSLTPDQVLEILQNHVTPFPSGSTCTTSLCGSGILNAEAAVAYVASISLTSTISGNAGVSGATISFTGGTPVLADGSGNFSLTVPYNWSGTITPSLTGYTFEPTNQSFSSVTSDRTGVDFIAILNKFSLIVNTTSNSGTGSVISSPEGIDCGATCNHEFDYNTSVTLTASPTAGGYDRFTGWNGGGCSGTSTCTVVMTAPTEVEAVFERSIFTDVPFDHVLYPYITALYDAGYTKGCSLDPLKYCPDQTMTRAESAVFMLRGNFGNNYIPPAEPWGTFADNWSNEGSWAEKWAEGMWDANLTAGCQTNPLKFCPWDNFNREQAAVFGLRLKYGISYVPPAASGAIFADMTDPNYWATKWAEQAYAEGILPACGTQDSQPLYCPSDLVTRGWGAYVVVNSKGLPLP